MVLGARFRTRFPTSHWSAALMTVVCTAQTPSNDDNADDDADDDGGDAHATDDDDDHHGDDQEHAYGGDDVEMPISHAMWKL